MVQILFYILVIFYYVAGVNVFHIFLQMSVWRPSEATVYLPPVPVSKVVSTDEYVFRTSIYYYAGSSRLLTVGHPYFSIKNTSSGNGKKVLVPKVSGLQYRVFRIKLPDPNKFGFPDTSFYNPETQRLVWACTGLEIGRGQPLGVGISGHPLLNKFDDTETSNKYAGKPGIDNRECLSMDYKQTQLCILGCKPPIGEHWGKGTPCNNNSGNPGDCPPLQLINSVIQDGDMVDTGFGCMDFNTLQASKSDVPIDICSSVCKYPDYLQMASEPYGDSLFFFLRREQMFVRHFFNRAGTLGDPVPGDLYIQGSNSGNTATVQSSAFFPTPSGSMVTSESQLFNKPYWLQRAQGHNNGICWGNQLFVTVVDTTRSTNMTLCAEVKKESTYKNENFKEYLRHGEEFDLQFIFQLCKITLTADVMTYIHKMDATILEDWQFGLTPPPSASLEDTYRFVTSTAITCQKNTPPKGKEDPLKDYMFWEVDLKEKFSADLDQFPLGRKFLLQAGLQARPKLKRPASSAPRTSTKKKKVKR
uniref:Major capsid protein L1 n=1 Tax=Human papillomavirus 52 TaxID=10618 RepID=A0A075LYY5_HPV52|nr:L1 protein [human papillomavirus 52]